MGLAASQARLLTLTSRKSDVEYRLMDIANQKLAMSRDSSKLSEDYSNALNAKVLTWDKADGGTTPLTYDLLMTQNDDNSAGQFLISDSRGRVMLDSAIVNKLGLSGTTQSADAGISENLFLQKMMAPLSSTDADAYINQINGTGSTASEVALTTMATDFANVLSYAVSDNNTKTYNDDQLENFKTALTTASSDVNQEIQALSGLTTTQMTYLNDTDKWASLAYDASGDTLTSDNIKGELGCVMTTTTKDTSGNIIGTPSIGTQKSTAVSVSGVSVDGSVSTYSMAADTNVASIKDTLTTIDFTGANNSGSCSDDSNNEHTDNTDVNGQHWNVAGTRLITYNDGTAAKTENVAYVFGSYTNGTYGDLKEVRDYGSTAVKIGPNDHQGHGIIGFRAYTDDCHILNTAGADANPTTVTKFSTVNGAKTTSTDNYNSSGTKVSTTSATYDANGYSSKYKELEYLVRLKRSISAAQQLLNLYAKDGGDATATQTINAAISMVLSGGSAKSSGVTNTDEVAALLAQGDDGDDDGTGISLSNANITSDGSTYKNYLDYNQDGAWKNSTCEATNYELNPNSNFSENLTDLFSNYKTIRTNRTQDDTSNTLTNINTANYYTNLWEAMNSQGWVLDKDMDTDTSGKALQNLVLNGEAYIYKHNDDGSWSLTSTSTTDTPLNTENDSNASTAAEAKYDAEKDKVDYKESQLDINMNNLDTERSAIDTEMESVQKIIDSNIKKFKIFDA